MQNSASPYMRFTVLSIISNRCAYDRQTCMHGVGIGRRIAQDM